MSCGGLGVQVANIGARGNRRALSKHVASEWAGCLFSGMDGEPALHRPLRGGGAIIF